MHRKTPDGIKLLRPGRKLRQAVGKRTLRRRRQNLKEAEQKRKAEHEKQLEAEEKRRAEEKREAEEKLKRCAAEHKEKLDRGYRV